MSDRVDGDEVDWDFSQINENSEAGPQQSIALNTLNTSVLHVNNENTSLTHHLLQFPDVGTPCGSGLVKQEDASSVCTLQNITNQEDANLAQNSAVVNQHVLFNTPNNSNSLLIQTKKNNSSHNLLACQPTDYSDNNNISIAFSASTTRTEVYKCTNSVTNSLQGHSAEGTSDMGSTMEGESMDIEPVTVATTTTHPGRVLRSRSLIQNMATPQSSVVLDGELVISNDASTNETRNIRMTNALRCILGIPEVITNNDRSTRSTSVIVDGRNQSQPCLSQNMEGRLNDGNSSLGLNTIQDNASDADPENRMNLSNNVEMEEPTDDIHEMLTQNPTTQSAAAEVIPNQDVEQHVDNMQEEYEELQTEVDVQIARINEQVSQIESLINQSTNNSMEQAEVNTSEPPNKITKLNESTTSEDGGQTCPICFDVWTSSGDHRLTSLKCGHLFGHSCIKRWLQEKGKETKNCPTCKSKAKLTDLRFIYAKNLCVIDNTEVEQLKVALEATEEAKKRVELELQKSELNNYMYRKRVEACEFKISELEQYRCKSEQLDTGRAKRLKMALFRTLEITSDNSCKFVSYSQKLCQLYASQISSNPLFPGYGVRKFSLETFGTGKFIRLHSKPIRGMSYSYENNMLLSVSLDKTAKLLNEHDSIAITLSPDICLWSCCWDVEHNNRLLLGGVGGVVLHYDIRQPKTYLNRICSTGDMYPVDGVESVPGGFISCRHNSFNLHKRSSGYAPHTLPIEGPFMSTNYNQKSNHILMSAKVSAENDIRHIVGRADLMEDPPRFEKIQTINGGNKQFIASRSTLMNVGEDVWVAAYNESITSVCLWNAETGKQMQMIGAQDGVLSMCPITYNSKTLLATQTSKKTRIYELVET